MNIYARFFDYETLVHSTEELIDFLNELPEIKITDDLVEDLYEYINSDIPYPKRYKIRPRVYFIVIKTNAETMEEFRANRKNNDTQKVNKSDQNDKDSKTYQLSLQQYGWYKGNITFKRVLPIPGTAKFQYQDTEFEALVKAQSALECYNRIIAHLKGRPDVDMRSQFPAAKGTSFSFEFLGENITLEENKENTESSINVNQSEEETNEQFSEPINSTNTDTE